MTARHDIRARVVSMETLRALCAMTSHRTDSRFTITSVSRSRIHVECVTHDGLQIAAIFPCFPDPDQGEQPHNPLVALVDMHTPIGAVKNAFKPLLETHTIDPAWSGTGIGEKLP